MRRLVLSASVASVVVIAGTAGAWFLYCPRWTEEELALARSLSLSELPPTPEDPSNRVADDPDAVELGRAIFFDTRFSGNGEVACATCHLPERQFQDDLPLAVGMGTTTRRTMPISSRTSIRQTAPTGRACHFRAGGAPVGIRHACVGDRRGPSVALDVVAATSSPRDNERTRSRPHGAAAERPPER